MTKITIAGFGLALSLLSACGTSTTGTPPSAADDFIAYPGYTGVYPGFTLVLDEQFNEFNDEIWKKGDGGVGGESMCRFQDRGVQVVDGQLELIVEKGLVEGSWSEDHQQEKGDYEYSCGEMRTHENKRIRYGRIETRMLSPDRETASGYISSLFTYIKALNEQGQEEWEEIDVELEGVRPDKFQANLIYGHDTWEWRLTRDFGAWEDKIVIGPVDEWRVFAIEWLPDQIRWYVDGKLMKTLTQADIDCKPDCVPPQIYPTPIPDDFADIMVNFWIPADDVQDGFGGNKVRNVYPMKAKYDWIRYYQYDAEPIEHWQAEAQ